MNVQISKKHIAALALACTFTALSSVTLAGGSHGHGHAKKAESQGHGEEGHAKIDYAKVEEHAFGKASDPEHAHTTITIDMLDKLRFAPESVQIKRGDTVRFVVKNSGKLMHEMVLGTDESLKEHAAVMMKFPGMEHDEPHMAHVAPGKQLVMGWQFTKAGTFNFGCLVPGHYEAGMKGTIIVQ
ncbi:MAG: cupredoxin family protein [Chromatiales bacterium]|jgi:uncharacterized cupredoxin-like copper-binding protein|nr:cupredoxin family protein [Chromatiales bacterium]